jgi:hypothetical protein
LLFGLIFLYKKLVSNFEGEGSGIRKKTIVLSLIGVVTMIRQVFGFVFLSLVLLFFLIKYSDSGSIFIRCLIVLGCYVGGLLFLAWTLLKGKNIEPTCEENPSVWEKSLKLFLHPVKATKSLLGRVKPTEKLFDFFGNRFFPSFSKVLFIYSVVVFFLLFLIYAHSFFTWKLVVEETSRSKESLPGIGQWGLFFATPLFPILSLLSLKGVFYKSSFSAILGKFSIFYYISRATFKILALSIFGPFLLLWIGYTAVVLPIIANWIAWGCFLPFIERIGG